MPKIVVTRRFPHGEIEPFQHPKFGDPVPPTRYRPDTPKRLEAVLPRALAGDPHQRLETAEELLLALECGELQPLSAPPSVPLLNRSAMVRWQAVSLISLAINALLVYLLFLR